MRRPRASRWASAARAGGLAALAVLVACDGGPPTGERTAAPPAVARPPHPTDEARCPAVLAHLTTVLATEAGALPGAMAMAARVLAILTDSCSEERWPLALRACVVAVPVAGPRGGLGGLAGCAALVPAPLRAELEPRLRALQR